ncbi:MAG TPA: hypothetical protein VG184_12695 [Acidimicrobiales bacterium]|jgi:hypothetical protein|nr:hypothetical protein [Acidimicrobiales bacterium]
MTRAQDDLLDLPDHRRRTTRKVRHTARTSLHTACGDGDALDETVFPEGPHDIGRKASPRPRKAPAPGRRPGFKVWKTPFWKRRRQLWHERNAAERRIADAE